MSGKSPEEVVLAWNDAYSKMDVDTAETFFSKDFLRYGDWSQWQPVGPERWGVGQKRFFAAFPDWTWDIEHITASGDTVVVEFLEQGTFTEPYEVLPDLTIEPTGTAYADHDCIVFRVDNEEIVEIRAFMTNDLDRKYHLESKIADFIASRGTTSDFRWKN
jgi:ketosteroid isomerase-like protein